MEQREHLRIQIPLLVELTHPAVGSVQSTARDVSAGGVFVALADTQIRVGAKVKLRLMTVLPTDTQPTPTVDMKVERVTEEGLGLSFINRTAEHLWGSVKHLREELAIGRDYFQLHQSAAVTHETKGLLLVQQNGKWLLPGHYLMVGENNVSALRHYLETQLGVQLEQRPQAHSADSAPEISVVEAATYSVVFTAPTASSDVQLPSDSEYKDWRWVGKVRDLREITFASDAQRQAAESVLASLMEE